MTNSYSTAQHFVLIIIAAHLATTVQATQRRYSDMGPTGNADYIADDPAVAYNPIDDEYLAVWSANDDRDGQSLDEFEIFIQRIDARSGQEVGTNDQRISAVGGLGTPSTYGRNPAIAYNADAHEYLVVWSTTVSGDSGPLIGRRLDATTLQPQGGEIDFTEGLVGSDPALVYHIGTGDYLLAWTSHEGPGLVDGEREILIRRLAGMTALPLGDASTRISTMGPDGGTTTQAVRPSVAADTVLNRYAVVWGGSDIGNGIHQIFIQLLNAAGDEIGGDDLVVNTGAPSAFSPQIAHNPRTSQFGDYLVVWASRISNEQEIYGRPIRGLTGIPFAGEDRLISDTDATNGLRATSAAIIARDSSDDFVVTWIGQDPLLAFEESEVFAALVPLDATPRGRFRISNAGGTGSSDYEVEDPALVAGPNGSALVIWTGEDNRGGLVDEEFEIFGSIFESTIFADGFDTGTTAAWSIAAGE